MENAGPLISTFSIVGYDPEEPAWGIAISSKFLAVGARTCFGAPDAGVVVIQAYANSRNGTEGIALLQQGIPAKDVISRLMDKDPYRDVRQMAIIDPKGSVESYTGKDCGAWAGSITGKHCAAQGNMLLGGEGCQAMVDDFASSTGSLARRLVNSLTLCDEIAGDFRGRQAAALYIVRQPWSEPVDVFTEPIIDLRVDDHENPFVELSRLLDIYELLYQPTSPHERLPLDKPTLLRFQKVLTRLGYFAGEASGIMDEPTRAAAQSLARIENFRKRLLHDEDWVDGRLLTHLEAKAGIK